MVSKLSAGEDNCTRSTTLRRSRSMSGWKKRLNSDTPAPPAASAWATKFGSELKKGDSFIVTGMFATVFSARSSAR